MSRAPKVRKQTSMIQIVIKDLAQEQADVLVNTIGTNAKLVSGSVTYAILETGGNSIQDQINWYHPHGLKIGDVAETSGGNLQCQRVFHVVLRQWKNVNDEAESLLRRVVTECLQKAATYGFMSIAFPALGTGFLRFPQNRSADIMFQAIENFLQKNLMSTLQTVKIVLHPRDEISIKEFMGRRDGFAVSHENYLSRTIMLKTVPAQFQLQVVMGCLSQLQADVLVNTTQSDLNLSVGAVSRSLLMKGGQILQTESRMQCPGGYLPPGQMVQTRGGSLSCHRVFHVVLSTWNEGKGGSEETFKSAVMNCLQEASKMNFRSIGFPLLGSGYLEYPPQKSADLILETITKFLMENPTSLQTVSVVIAHKDTAIRKIVERQLEVEGETTSALRTAGSGLLSGESLAQAGSEVKYFPFVPGGFAAGSVEEQHFNWVVSHFYASITKDKTNRHVFQISKVEYAVNPELINKFRSAQERMLQKYGSYGQPVMAYHGTPKENVKSICREGFRQPDHEDFEEETDCGWYGNGIYLSEYARFAMNYMKKSKRLLLCKVLQGKVFKCKQLNLGAPKEPGFDSHVDPFGKELVIYDDDCILPCYIVHFNIIKRFKLEGDPYDPHENDDTEIQYLSEMEMHKGEQLPGF